MNLKLEFVHQNRKPWISLGLLFIVTLWTVSLVVSWVSLHSHISDRQKQVAELEELSKNKYRSLEQTSIKNDTHLDVRVANSRKILKSLNYPWNQVLSTIEQTNGGDVAILSLDHTQNSNQTQLTVEASDLLLILKFVEKLNIDNEENKWYISTYQIQTQSNPPTIKSTILNRL
ncbi:hypothetical protein [Undibacterium flavidum]|uniref:Uncharacterized protein n=1 Tax=Undibacterium flavidum TaxID=2762297 RepID=A0ABR6YB35_9BURK|nr:hypothetical protein [Undibacterium flavidum]MBC3873830.1 hypothetical protein [Undibacterium flavidum]